MLIVYSIGGITLFVLSVYLYGLLDRKGILSHWWFIGDIRATFLALLLGSELDGPRRHGRLVLEPETPEEIAERSRKEWRQIVWVIALMALIICVMWILGRSDS